MKIKVKRSDLFLMQNAVNALAHVKGSCKFAYALAKNKKFLDDEVNLMREGVNPKQDFIAYEKARIALCEKFAEKDENDKPKIAGGQYQGLENNKKFQAEMGKLVEEYKEKIEERKAQLESFNEMIKEEVELEMWAIKLGEIPNEISADQIGVLTSLIVEE